MLKTKRFIDNLYFPESGRFHQNKLWFVDIWGKTIYQADSQGVLTEVIKIKDNPAAIAWLSDGSMLITSLFDRLLLCFDGNSLKTYADLSQHAPPGYCHDMVVSDNDVIYLSNSGFYPKFNAKVVTSPLVKIDNDKVSYAAKNLGYPNGLLINNNQLIVAETFAARLSVFDITNEGCLTNHSIWANFDDLGFDVSFDKQGIPVNKERVYPDGICQGDNESIWVSSPGTKEVLCIKKGGQIINRIKTQGLPFDCIKSADDTLYIMTSDVVKNEKTGKIEIAYL